MGKRQTAITQIVWGGLIFGMGTALLFRVQSIIPEIEQVDAFSSDITFKRICLYLIGIILMGGGIKKIKTHYKTLTGSREEKTE